MNTKIKTSLGVVIIVIIAITTGVFVWKYYSLNPIPDVLPRIQNPKSKTSEKNTQMANPASVFCEKNGGTIEIRTDENGGQIGICKLANGFECEEWEYYKTGCPLDFGSNM